MSTLDIAALSAALLDAFGPADRARLQRALDLATECHAGQQRDDGTIYLVHPLKVALVLVKELGVDDIDTACAALLHDTLEDCPSLTPDSLRLSFGPAVTEIVEALTKPKAQPREEVNAVYFARLRAACECVRTIKLADRLDNVRDLPTSPHPRKRRRMADETRAFYLPLIDTLPNPHHRATLTTAYAAALSVVE